MHMDDIRTTVTLPPDVHQRVKELAARERRTFSGQLLWLVERGLAVEEAWQQERQKGRTR